MTIDKDLVKRLYCYDPDSGDLIHLARSQKGYIAGAELNGHRVVGINRIYYPYWKIIAAIICEDFPVSVIYIDDNPLNTSRKNLKFIKPTI